MSVVPSAIPERIGLRPESPVGKLRHPGAEGRAGNRDHPGRPPLEGRVDPDGEETRAQGGEESAEGAASHPGIMVGVTP